MRCVGVAEIRFIKYFRDEGMGKSVENMVVVDGKLDDSCDDESQQCTVTRHLSQSITRARCGTGLRAAPSSPLLPLTHHCRRSAAEVEHHTAQYLNRWQRQPAATSASNCTDPGRLAALALAQRDLQTDATLTT